ncbi:MAG: MFS transporter [Candidatus Lokiarchaeota archaeon]|nr:MFS transporter [Candidatus Lokiarchaeota archaeon]MBD3342993.1 MFS transporter [Candidatus Lokiarchaeota archaeon]
MDDKSIRGKDPSYSNKKLLAYGIGQTSDITAYQTFTFLVFTFYFAVIGVNVILITLGFIIWSIWNSINDPFIGYLSDRTHTKWGRRIPYIMISTIPLALITFLLFVPPKTFGITDQITNFVYFLIIIICFELFFTMYDLNFTALFPELFIDIKDRAKANLFRQSFLILGLFMAFILPGLFISDYSDPRSLPQYQIFGIVIAVVIIIPALIFLKFSPKEKEEFKEDYKGAQNLFGSIKLCLKSKSFRWYIPAEVATWFVYGLLPTIMPLYGKFVLGIENTLLLSMLLALTFISIAIFMNILWKPLAERIGPRKSWLISMTIFVVSLVPLMFITTLIEGIIVFFLIGIGMSGSIYLIDLIIGDIVDEDEVLTGSRSEGAYYGVNMFLMHLSTVFVFLAISLVFTNVGWAVFEPTKVTPQIIFGLRALMFIFPALALIIGIIVIYKYPLDGNKLKELKERLLEIHTEKKLRKST